MPVPRKVFASAVVATVTIGLAVVAMASTPRMITLTARKFEWNPARIEAHVGETIELTLESEDVKHGFSCKDLGIEKVKFKKGERATVTFTADKPGTYRFRCAHFCGMGHRRMKGEIVVTP